MDEEQRVADHDGEMHEVVDLGDGNINEVEEVDMDEEGVIEDGLTTEENRDDSTCTFSGHKDPVFCIKFNPVNNALIATGGQDDSAFLWNSTSGEIVFKCTGHKDSVTQIDFSNDGALLATGDMAGFIQVWQISTKECIWSFEVSDLEWLGWHYGTRVLFASDVEGTVWMWKVLSGDCKTYSNAGVAATCCRLLPGGSSLMTGYSNGVLKIWDLSSSSCKLTISGNDSHQAAITCMAVLHKTPEENNHCISGSVNGSVHLYDYKSGKLLKRFDCSGGGGEGEECSVEDVSLCSSRPLAAVATNIGDIFVLDLRSQTTLHKINTEQVPVTKVEWYIDSPLLYAADAAGVVSLWDGRTGESTAKFYGHIAEIHDIAVSRHGVVFASASEDGTAKVYAVSADTPS
ncbi:angio-associated migratory cell protein-like [Watersipora subatra]|uniref:angio-associated migratory cell protein-like n=1 Tax=Watersipora subatra TaxID=2589382 RepID=UPI00355AF882